jgi:ubiquinone/menaquinone biosynthesis C-methylase UbiE
MNPSSSGASRALTNRDLNTGRVESYYDQIASLYDARYVNAFFQIYDAVTFRHLDEILKHVSLDTPMLDVGCGTGHIALFLASRGYQNITAVDISDSMLSQLEANSITQGVRDCLTIERADFHDMAQYTDGQFGAVICQGSVLDCSVDHPRAISEMRRVLKTSGFMNLSVHNRQGCGELIADIGEPGDLEEAFGTGKWYWYEDGKRIHDFYLFTEEDLSELAEKSDMDVYSIVGKVVLSRTFVEAVPMDSDQYREVRDHCMRLASHEALRRTAQYTDVTFRAR